MALKLGTSQTMKMISDLPAAEFEKLFSLTTYRTRDSLHRSLALFLDNLPTSGCSIFDCWQWRGFVDQSGYGRFGQGFGTPHLARIVWMITTKAPIPKRAEVAHRCDIRHCCNPFHLEMVSHKIKPFRQRRYQIKRTCPRGHRKVQSPRGKWECRTCIRIATDAWLDKDGNRERQNQRRSENRKSL